LLRIGLDRFLQLIDGLYFLFHIIRLRITRATVAVLWTLPWFGITPLRSKILARLSR